MVGVWHGALGALLSAHQSIGVAEPLRMFGSEEQKREWLPRVARTDISAFLLTEPDVGSDPARVATSAEPVEGGYVLNGTKLWATNGAIADVVVVMARVPKSEGHKGGISAFILDYKLRGRRRSSTATRSWACAGSRTRSPTLENVFVPAENLIGKEGWGLKIALSTLNTGRLALPAICVGQAKWATKIAREWSTERVQWGRPVGKHDAVAQKNAFIAASAFGLEAMLDVASRLADEKRNDIRIEAAIAKLYGSELAWTVLDELVQVRGGRGYETAESLKARGEKPVPVEQMLRDTRINRIFEGSTEIMHLLIAREAVDTAPAGRGRRAGRRDALGDKAKAPVASGAFYAKWAPKLVVGEGNKPRALRRVRRPGRATCATSSAPRAGSRARRSTRWAAGRPSSSSASRSSAGSSTSAPSCSRSPPPSSTPRRSRGRHRSAPTPPASSPTCSAPRPSAAPTGCSTSSGPTTTTRATRPR